MRTARRLVTVMGGGFPKITLPQNLLNGDPVALEAFDSATGWTPTKCAVTEDTTNKVEGTAALKIAMEAAETNHNITASRAIATSGSAAVRIAFRNPPTGVVLTQGGIYMGVGGWTKYRFVAFNSNHKYWNRYQYIPADWSNSGGCTWSDTATLLQINPKSAAGEGPELWVDQFEKLPALPTPAVLLTIDDGNESAYSKAFAYCQARGINATLYMISGDIGGAGKVSAEQLTVMHNNGWDIGNHSTSATDLTTLTQEQAQTALAGCKTALDALGLSRSSAHVAYPSGGYNDTVRAAMTAEGMLTGRTVHLAPSPTLPLIDPYTIETKVVKADVSLATAKGYIDTAISHGTICSLLFHDIVDADVDDYEWSTANFQALIDYIIAQQITPLTISQLYALQSGAVTVTRPW